MDKFIKIENHSSKLVVNDGDSECPQLTIVNPEEDDDNKADNNDLVLSYTSWGNLLVHFGGKGHELSKGQLAVLKEFLNLKF